MLQNTLHMAISAFQRSTKAKDAPYLREYGCTTYGTEDYPSSQLENRGRSCFKN